MEVGDVAPHTAEQLARGVRRHRRGRSGRALGDGGQCGRWGGHQHVARRDRGEDGVGRGREQRDWRDGHVEHGEGRGRERRIGRGRGRERGRRRGRRGSRRERKGIGRSNHSHIPPPLRLLPQAQPVLVADDATVRWPEKLRAEIRMLSIHWPRPAESPLILGLLAVMPRTVRTRRHNVWHRDSRQ
jgi:hypothetical protein